MPTKSETRKTDTLFGSVKVQFEYDWTTLKRRCQIKLWDPIEGTFDEIESTLADLRKIGGRLAYVDTDYGLHEDDSTYLVWYEPISSLDRDLHKIAVAKAKAKTRIAKLKTKRNELSSTATTLGKDGLIEAVSEVLKKVDEIGLELEKAEKRFEKRFVK